VSDRTLFPYYVEFYKRDGTAPVNRRVEAENVKDAIDVAAREAMDHIFHNDAQWGTRVMLVDEDAEAEERRENAHLYTIHDDTVDLIKRYGFVTEEKGYWRHENGLYAHVDHHLNGQFGRFAGVYQHRIAPNGSDIMVAIAQIPWYGDGATPSESEEMLEALLQIVTKK